MADCSLCLHLYMDKNIHIKRYLCATLLFGFSLVFTSCSDDTLEENEQLEQINIQNIDKEDYEVPPNG